MPKSDAPRKRNKPANKRPSKDTKEKTQTQGTVDAMPDLMADLREADSNSRSMLEQVASFSPYLTNKALVDAGDREQIHNYSAILSRDTIQMRQELDAIWMQIPEKLDPNNSDDVANAINIGGRYNDWQERYERVIMPTIEQLKALLEDAANNYQQSDAIAEAQFEEVPKGESDE